MWRVVPAPKHPPPLNLRENETKNPLTMKTITDFKKKFNKGAKLSFMKVVDENGVESKWLQAVANGAKVICKPDQKVTDKSSIREIKPGVYVVSKVYTSTVAFTV